MSIHDEIDRDFHKDMAKISRDCWGYEVLLLAIVAVVAVVTGELVLLTAGIVPFVMAVFFGYKWLEHHDEYKMLDVLIKDRRFKSE